MPLVKEAVELLCAGISVFPADGETKHPYNNMAWRPYIETLPDESEVARWFSNGACIAAICGPVSGNLEIIDFDEEGYADKWKKILQSWNCQALLEKLVIEKSKRKGRFHIAYRHQGQPDGNQKLARRSIKETLIETRGIGGYCLIAPSPGYTLIQGSWLELPTLSADERDTLLAAARQLDEVPIERPKHNQGRVGDEYNERASIDEILIPLGWQRDKSGWSNEEYWVRPGKDPRKGHSATWNYKGLGYFICFSSSAGLETNRGYDKFGLYAALHHNGDFQAAAKAAAKSGYGSDRSGFAAKKNVQVARSVGPRNWVTMDEVEASEVPWLVYPYLPLGIGYVLLYGDSGQGKSTSLLAIIADLSNGVHPFTKETIEPIKSIILSAEDSASYVVKPRLQKFGANMRNIMVPEEFLEDGTPNPLILDEDGAQELMERTNDFGARIIGIDPLTAYFDGDNINDRLQARTWTRRITDIAITCNCCPIIVHHVNKGTAAQGRYRAAGSQDFFDASRSALMAVQSSTSPDDYALSHEKHNLSPRGDSLGYTFSKERGFEWTGASDLTSEVAMIQMEEHVEPGKLKGCKEWILEQLEGNPMLSDDLQSGAKKQGFSLRTYRSARAELGQQLRSWKEKTENGKWWTEIRHIEDVYRG